MKQRSRHPLKGNSLMHCPISCDLDVTLPRTPPHNHPFFYLHIILRKIFKDIWVKLFIPIHPNSSAMDLRAAISTERPGNHPGLWRANGRSSDLRSGLGKWYTAPCVSNPFPHGHLGIVTMLVIMPPPVQRTVAILLVLCTILLVVVRISDWTSDTYSKSLKLTLL